MPLSVFQPLSVFLRANSCRVSQWTADTVDQILTEGDAMYVKAFDDGTIPDTENNVADAYTRPSTLAYGDCWSSQTKPIAHCQTSKYKTQEQKLKIKIELLRSDCLRKNFNNGI